MNFLDLPPPIRTRIYICLILQTPLDPAPSLAAFHDSDPYQRLFRHSASIAEVKIERSIHYPSRVYLGFEGLLRVSWGVRTEVKKVLKDIKHSKEKVDCKLDVLVDSAAGGGVGGIWPTWLLCPMRNPTVRRLHIDVRVFENEFGVALKDGHGPILLREFSNGALGFAHSHVGREKCRTLAFATVAVIARFIERGARWGHVRGDLSIETLVLNFMNVRPVHAKETFLELTPLEPPTPPTPVDAQADGNDDYWDTDTLVSEKDEGNAFSDNALHRRPSEVADEEFDATDMLRMVDLVLKPLNREERYMLATRKNHFSAVHLGFIRRNVSKVVIELEGKLKRRMKVTI